MLHAVVISHKMSKTAVVRVDALKKHPKYGKYRRVSKKFKAHDEKDEYRIGDGVRIQETRPLSKEKRWKIVGLVKRVEAEAADDEEVKNEMRSSENSVS